MPILSIYDASGAVYKAVGTRGLETSTKGELPFGGIEYMLRTIIGEVARFSEVVVAFDSRSFRKDISTDYKKGRKARPDVWVQLDVLREIFDMADIPYMKKDNYEADDIIYSCCEYWNRKGSPMYAINIYSTDHDLIHNLKDNNKVKFRGLTSNVQDVNNIEQYEMIGANKARKIKYNTKTAWNILFGDSDYVERDSNGNKISFKLEDGTTAVEIYDRMCFIIDKYNISGDNSRTEAFFWKVMNTFNLTPKDKERLEKLTRIFYPVLIKDLKFATINKSTILSSKFARMIRSINDPSLESIYKSAITNLAGVGELDNLQDILNGKRDPAYSDLFKSSGRRYRSGAYMVDNNLSVNDVDVEDSSVMLTEFLDIF